ncbi:hypothetical protein T12_2268 [Trichinella patagoniensis]|uniref:Uncharacterized protein n=1 Tax=Trichinella patagoniensis TaxID=990121 RepID=A0A0V1A0U5_9BILA|nr:hypothetical protein T12_2268 [Trichinella patagoniensis]
MGKRLFYDPKLKAEKNATDIALSKLSRNDGSSPNPFNDFDDLVAKAAISEFKRASIMLQNLKIVQRYIVCNFVKAAH